MHSAHTEDELDKAKGDDDKTQLSADEMYRALFGAIVDHALLPGTPLREQDLATAFGVSRARVRELLLRMNMMGIVELPPFRSAYVAKPTEIEARENFEARRVLETGIVSKVIARITDDDLAKLKVTLDKEAKAIADGNRMDSIRHSGEFHIQLCAILGNQQLSDMLHSLVSRTSLVLAVFPPSGLSSCDCDNHAHIFDRLAARDRDGAVAALVTDLTDAEASLRFSDAGDGEEGLSALLKGYLGSEAASDEGNSKQ